MNKSYSAPFLVLLFSACLTGVARGDQFDVFAQRFSGTSQSLHGVTYGVGAYVAVGDNGTILYSTDTVTWIPRVSGTTNHLYGIKCGPNGFVAVGDSAPGSPGTILTSIDGVSWVQQTSPVTNKMSAICYGAGRYVAVGSHGTIITSTNGVNWTAINTGAPYDLNGADNGSLISNAYVFVVVGDSGTIMTSSDGLSWTLRFSGTFSRLAADSFFYGLVTAAGDGGTIVTSPDTTTWTVQTSETSSNLTAVANDGNGRFGAVGLGGAFVTAQNGLVWTLQPAVTSSNYNGVVYTNGNFLAVGDSGMIRACVAWLPRDSGTAQTLICPTYGNGEFVAAGYQTIQASSNGVNWTTAYTNSNIALSWVVFGSNLFVALGGSPASQPANGMILTSSDGLNWIERNLGTTNIPHCIVYGNGVYVAMGTGGIVYRSADGTNWTHSFPVLPFPADGSMTFAANLFIATAGNTVATSPDGLIWAGHDSNGAYNLGPVAFGNGTFVTVGALNIGNSQMATSPDGTNWTARNTGGAGYYALAYGDQGFAAPGFQLRGSANVCSTTLDGIAWTTRATGGDDNGPQVHGAAFGNGAYLLVGDGGMIRQSTPTNAQAAPLISGYNSNGVFRLNAIAQPGYTYRIQASSNLVNWADSFVFTSTQTVTSFTDTASTSNLHRYYRIKTP
jgi:hypothetical protein